MLLFGLLEQLMKIIDRNKTKAELLKVAGNGNIKAGFLTNAESQLFL